MALPSIFQALKTNPFIRSAVRAAETAGAVAKETSWTGICSYGTAFQYNIPRDRQPNDTYMTVTKVKLFDNQYSAGETGGYPSRGLRVYVDLKGTHQGVSCIFTQEENVSRLFGTIKTERLLWRCNGTPEATAMVMEASSRAASDIKSNHLVPIFSQTINK